MLIECQTIGCLPITAQSVAAATTASLDTSYTANQVTSQSGAFYSFRPTVSGTYRINVGTSTNNGYARVGLYRQENTSSTYRLANVTATNHDPVYLDYAMTAGTTYYIRPYGASNSKTTYSWQINRTVTISFDGNGSTSTMNSVTATLNAANTLPACTMTRTGFVFAGWATSATGDVEYADQGSITPTGDMKLYAKWNETSSVTWNSTVINKKKKTGSPSSFTSDGFTVERVGSASLNNGQISVTAGTSNGLRFVSSVGNITRIEIACSSSSSASNLPAGWSKNGNTLIWTGSSESVSLSSVGSGKQIYAYGVSSITFTYVPTAKTIEFTVNGYSDTYDGNSHGIDVQVTAPASGYTIEYTLDDPESSTAQWTTTNPTVTDVTDEAVTVNFRITASGYTAATGSATIVINPATISYTAENYTTTYDGQPHGINVQVTAPTSGSSIQYRYDDVTEWSTVNPTFTTGTHTVYFTISAPNYTTTEVDSRTVTIDDATMQFTATGSTSTYDGQPHEISVEVTTPASGYDIEYTLDDPESPEAQWTTTSPTFTDAGTHPVHYRISATGYVTVTGTENVVINPGTIVYNAANYTGTYDGQAHSITLDVTTPATGYTIEYGTSTTGPWSTTVPTRTDAGTTTVYWRITAANYETQTGQNTITVQNGEIIYSADGYEGFYDGQPHSISVTVTTPASGATIQYREQGHHTWRDSVSFTNAGTHTVEYRIQAANYETVTGSATVNIKPAAISYSAQGYSGTYDGQDHTISVSVSAPANAQIRYRNAQGWYTLTNPPTYSVVGTYLVYYRITANNYQTVESSATVEITAADMTVTATGYSAPYDGAAHGIEVEVTTPSSGATVLYGESADACTLTTCPTYSYGEHTVYYLVTAPNYNDYSGSATVSISDIDIAATAEGYDGPYDGEAHGITVTVTEPASGASVMFGTEEGTYDMEVSPVFTEIGDHTVYYQVTAEGHNPLTGSATVSIGELTIDATVTPYDGVFDGAEHGVTVTVNTPEVGATVLFGTEAGVYDLDESPTYCEIGTYTVYYKISAEYYAPLEGSVVVRISENPDRDNAREALIELIAASDEILGEWEDLLPEDLVESLLDAEDAAYEVLNNEIASIEQLEAAADNLANALGNVLQYIAENYETEPELTPEQRTRLCVINFVENLYLHALGRPFDVSGRDTWVSLIMDQGGTGTQVARGFLGSQEFLGLGLDNEGFVKALYNALFNRVPEAEEVDTWTNALAAGVTREEVINAFFASPEWARTCAYYRVNI